MTPTLVSQIVRAYLPVLAKVHFWTGGAQVRARTEVKAGVRKDRNDPTVADVHAATHRTRE